MSNDLSIKMTLDNSDFSQKINEAKEATKQFESEAKGASAEMKKMSDTTKKSGNFMREYKRELKELKAQLLQLEEGTEEYTKAMQKLADKTFALRDINETARLSANDLGERLALVANTLGGLTQGYGAVVGVMNLFGIENEAVNNVLVKFQSIIAIVNGLQGLEGLSKTLPICTNMFKALIVQVKACSLAMKAIPYVAIASAIVGVVGFIIKQTKATKELTEEEKKAIAEAKKIEAVNKAVEEAQNNANKSAGEQLAKYKSLQVQWNLLGDDLNEKKKFIIQNASAFNDLGQQVDTVAQAEKILVDDTQNFCNAMRLRAQAMAIQNQIITETEKYYKSFDLKGRDYFTHYDRPKVGDYFESEDEAKAVGKSMYYSVSNKFSGTTSYKSMITADDIAGVSAYRNKEALKKRKEYEKQLEEQYNAKMTVLIQRLQNVYSQQDKNPYGKLTPKTTIPDYTPTPTPTNDKNNNNHNNNDDDQPQQVDLVELLKQSLINKGDLSVYNKAYVEQTGNELNSKNYFHDLTSNLQHLADASGNEVFIKMVEDLIKTLPTYEAPEKETSEVNVIQLAKDAVNGGDFTQLDEYIQQQSQATAGSVKFLESKISTLEDVQTQTTDLNLIGKVDNEVDRLKKELEELKKQIRAKTDPEGVQAEKQADAMNEAINKGNQIKTMTSQVGQMFSSISKMTDDATASWLNYFSTIIGSAGQLVAALQAVACAEAGANQASAGPFGWLAVGVAIASMIAAFASIPKFENGGIVGGNSYSGDKILIRANSSEMILSKTQQARLWGIINNGVSSSNNGGEVHFKISGKNLVGVLNNYQNKTNKVI